MVYLGKDTYLWGQALYVTGSDQLVGQSSPVPSESGTFRVEKAMQNCVRMEQAFDVCFVMQVATYHRFVRVAQRNINCCLVGLSNARRVARSV
jgi:hypothetical protein